MGQKQKQGVRQKITYFDDGIKQKEFQSLIKIAIEHKEPTLLQSYTYKPVIIT